MAAGRLIVTNNAAGSGHLKQSRLADQVVCVPHVRLTSGPIPIVTNPADFFVARLAMIDADPLGRDAVDWEHEAYLSLCDPLMARTPAEVP
ncbi:MAG TPA: hypothetical protein VGC41_24360 [Kofleriaceae bacterium]